jgi:2-haloalkanoic acid dehalogenase type II
LWEDVAGERDLGRRWREQSLRLVTSSGAYRPYEEVVVEAARAAGVPPRRAATLLERWQELAPFPDSRPALRAGRGTGLALAVVTNCSQRLADIAAAKIDVPWDAVVSAEAAGFYKPDPHAYRAGCDAVAVRPADALFIAGSPHDVPGAAGVGMDVVWVNRRNVPTPASVQPLAIMPTLEGLPSFLGISL